MEADVYAKNVYGANVLHVSAQGDAPLPLWYYVKNVGMSLSDVDNRGSTPLHWACYSKSEFALLFIVSMYPNLEAKDNNGFTPLHLAIKATGQM